MYIYLSDALLLGSGAAVIATRRYGVERVFPLQVGCLRDLPLQADDWDTSRIVSVPYQLELADTRHTHTRTTQTPFLPEVKKR